MKNFNAINETLQRHLSMAGGRTILLSGPWGCGKTFLWREKVVPSLDHPITVSLFGVDSLGSLKSAVMNAALIRKTELLKGKDVKRFAKDWKEYLFAGLRKGVDLIAGTDFASRLDPFDLVEPGLTICIDDVERASRDLPLEEILGAATLLAETKGCKVVLIMNEAHVMEREQDAAVMRRYRERVLTAHIEVSADMASIFDLLLDGRTPSTKSHAFVKAQRGSILYVFEHSKAENLRTLGRVIEKLSVLADLLHPSELQLPHVLLLTVLQIEADSGALRSSQFYSFNELALLAIDHERDGGKDRMAFLNRYFGESRTGSYEFSQALYDYVVAGYFDPAGMKQELAPPAQSFDELADLLRIGEAREWFFFSDNEYLAFASRVESTLSSERTLSTLHVLALMIYREISLDRAGAAKGTAINELVEKRLAENVARGDESFSGTQRIRFGELEAIWKPFMTNYDQQLRAIRQQAQVSKALGVIAAEDLDAFVELISSRHEGLRAVLDPAVYPALNKRLAKNRPFHYASNGLLVDELGKWTTTIVPDLEALRRKMVENLDAVLAQPSLGNADRVRVANLRKRCEHWPGPDGTPSTPGAAVDPLSAQPPPAGPAPAGPPPDVTD